MLVKNVETFLHFTNEQANVQKYKGQYNSPQKLQFY